MAKDANRIRAIINDVVAVSVVALCGTVIWSTIVNANTRCDVPPTPAVAAAAGRPSPAPPGEPISLDDTATLGSADAAVVIIEYSDFQCPYCARFAQDTLPALKAAYVESGQVAFAYKHLPLDAIHSLARRAAEAAECAGVQGRFWEMHDALFANQRELRDETLLQAAADLDLDRNAFTECLEGLMSDTVARHAEEASRLGLSGTPAFLIGLRQADGTVKALEIVTGARPARDFEAAIERVRASSAQQD